MVICTITMSARLGVNFCCAIEALNIILYYWFQGVTYGKTYNIFRSVKFS